MRRYLNALLQFKIYPEVHKKASGTGPIFISLGFIKRKIESSSVRGVTRRTPPATCLLVGWFTKQKNRISILRMLEFPTCRDVPAAWGLILKLQSAVLFSVQASSDSASLSSDCYMRGNEGFFEIITPLLLYSVCNIYYFCIVFIIL